MGGGGFGTYFVLDGTITWSIGADVGDAGRCISIATIAVCGTICYIDITTLPVAGSGIATGV